MLTLHHLLTRFAVYAEMVFMIWNGCGWVWLASAMTTFWIMFFISSAPHDIENEVANNNGETDFALFQVEHSMDYEITGNVYIDAFLSGGVLPHAVHHLLPFQQSILANIASEPVVIEEYEKLGRKWPKKVNFWKQRVPTLLGAALLRPMNDHPEYSFWEEHFSFKNIWFTILFILRGFFTNSPPGY